MAYTEQVVAARAAKKTVNLLPERTDLTEEQMQELMNKPIDEVIEITKNELADYGDTFAAHGLGGTIDFINDEIRNAETMETPETNPQEGQPVSTPVRKPRKTKQDKT